MAGWMSRGREKKACHDAKNLPYRRSFDGFFVVSIVRHYPSSAIYVLSSRNCYWVEARHKEASTQGSPHTLPQTNVVVLVKFRLLCSQEPTVVVGGWVDMGSVLAIRR